MILASSQTGLLGFADAQLNRLEQCLQNLHSPAKSVVGVHAERLQGQSDDCAIALSSSSCRVRKTAKVSWLQAPDTWEGETQELVGIIFPHVRPFLTILISLSKLK